MSVHWLMGFDIKKAIKIYELFATVVYKIKNFYPHDENPKKFKFEIIKEKYHFFSIKLLCKLNCGT